VVRRHQCTMLEDRKRSGLLLRPGERFPKLGFSAVYTA
jgi:hypothetical protein